MLTPRAAVSIRLILAGETSIRPATSSTVRPDSSRSARSRAPSSRRRTVGLALVTCVSSRAVLHWLASLDRQCPLACAFGTCHWYVRWGIVDLRPESFASGSPRGDLLVTTAPPGLAPGPRGRRSDTWIRHPAPDAQTTALTRR